MKLLLPPVAYASTLTFGWNRTWYKGTNNDWGLEIDLYADIGASYSLPLYDSDPYIIQEAKQQFYLGSKN